MTTGTSQPSVCSRTLEIGREIAASVLSRETLDLEKVKLAWVVQGLLLLCDAAVSFHFSGWVLLRMTNGPIPTWRVFDPKGVTVLKEATFDDAMAMLPPRLSARAS